MDSQSVPVLDLRGVACPMSFVKTRLYLDKIERGQMLTVLLDPGEPVESVTNSVAADGHAVLSSVEQPQGHFSVSIRKG